MTAHRRDVALIYHYDLDAALNGEQVDWQIIPVNLDAGRIGGDLCRQAADFPRRNELFAPAVAAPDADDGEPTPAPTAPGAGVANRDTETETPCSTSSTSTDPSSTPEPSSSSPTSSTNGSASTSTSSPTPSSTTSPSESPTSSPDESPQSSATRRSSTTSSRPSASPTAQMVAAANERRDALRERRRRMRESAVKTGRLAEFDAAWQAAGITKTSSDDEVQAALDAIEPPFDTTTDPRHVTMTGDCDGCPKPTDGCPGDCPARASKSQAAKPDSGGPLDERDLNALLDAVTKSEARAVVNGWLRQGNAAGCSWDPRTHPDVRHFEITRAALALAVATDGDDDVARTVLGLAFGDGPLMTMPFGQCLSVLTIDEAKRVTAIAEAFGITLGLRYTDDGQPVIEGDVAGVLERAA